MSLVCKMEMIEQRMVKIDFLLQYGMEYLKNKQGIVPVSEMISYLSMYAMTHWYVEERKARELATVALELIKEEADKAEKRESEKSPKQGEKERIPAAPRTT